MSVVGGLVCVFTIAFQCKFPTPWNVSDGQQCLDMVSPTVKRARSCLTRCSGDCGRALSSQP